MPLAEIAKLVNIGTLFAFLLVNIGVMVLRRTKPDLERGFRVPAVWICAPIGCILCLYLMIDLPATTWVRFVGWLVLGLADLLLLRAQALAAAAGRGRQPGGAVRRGARREDRRDELRAVREAVPARAPSGARHRAVDARHRAQNVERSARAASV